MPNIVGKLLTRATTLPLISFQSEVFTRSYGPLNGKNSNFGNLGLPT